MAKTFEQYTKMRDTGGHLPLEQKVNLAMDQGELIRGVAARVTAFLEYYEEDIAPTLEMVANIRATGASGEWKFKQHTADLAEKDVQTIASGPRPTEGSQRLLLLDDLKVLLDLLPEGYKP